MRSVSVPAALPLFGSFVAGGLVFDLRLVNGGERLPHHVVKTADQADDHSRDNSPRLRSEPSVNPVAEKRQAGGRARQFQSDTGVSDPAWEALSRHGVFGAL